jgi:beta-glucosidase
MFTPAPLLLFLLAPILVHTSPWPPSAKLRAQSLVSQMSLAQKLSLLQGSNQGTYAGTLPAIPSLGIPEFTLEDGPQGVGDGMGKVTAWPTTLTMAQSWDTPLLYTFGQAVGQEHFAKGVNVMLGPGSNIIRSPFNGRQVGVLQ